MFLFFLHQIQPILSTYTIFYFCYTFIPILPIRTFSDITCFRITGSYKEVLTFDNLVDISVILADYPAFLTSIQEQKTALQVFYNTHLKGNYTHAYELGKAFHYEAEMEYFQNHLTMNFSQYLQHQFLPNFCQTEQLDPTFVSHALSIYQNWTEYADKYLSLYGTQARFPDTLQFK